LCFTAPSCDRAEQADADARVLRRHYRSTSVLICLKMNLLPFLHAAAVRTGS
jgi:hypothetical protein